eukprot:TRINITY_DN4659_c0_g1_i2.p1 TRINITY_DN4659_c0_g1~~TRINITY_DN4659_c0_g1_i2.p1  ORF type:complete len:186 (+),score=62.96 TRINITY_DN4659_c0_g1_i2:233-790(+)
MTFPDDYPMSPPSLKFLSDFWHPNVYPDGGVCISILHPPGEDEMSGERPEERWLPTQTVSTILLSVISMLADPNISSPANVDASVEWRTDRERYLERTAALAERSRRQVPEHVVIPHPDTDPAEREKRLMKQRILNEDFNLYDGDMGFDEDWDVDFGDDEFHSYSGSFEGFSSDEFGSISSEEED